MGYFTPPLLSSLLSVFPSVLWKTTNTITTVTLNERAVFVVDTLTPQNVLYVLSLTSVSFSLYIVFVFLFRVEGKLKRYVTYADKNDTSR